MTQIATVSEFGHVLRDLRAQLGLSQADLAGRLRSTQRHVSFLETGRSHPSVHFLSRICRELELSVGQRANLFEASGLRNPYIRRDFQSVEITQALDMIEARVLNNWPFPALVLDPSWNILRQNQAFSNMFGALIPSENASPNLLSVMLSPTMRDMIANWDEAVHILYFRLQAAAASDPHVADIFATAKSQGVFDNLENLFKTDADVPVYVPIRIALPGGGELQMTSLLGQLASVQDALVEGFEIELMIPTDAQSEALLRQMSAG